MQFLEWLAKEPVTITQNETEATIWLGSGFSLIFAILVVAGIIACIFSKKLRNMFF